MHVVITGVAGFIGSHLAERLLEDGHQVTGLDSFTDNYASDRKRQNLVAASKKGMQFREGDLAQVDLVSLLAGADVVFHLAAIPGVRASWTDFDVYLDNNVRATHRLLEAARKTRVRRIVYASSSSVYGEALRYPTQESDVPRPHSPYGVSKLAAEQLCVAYAENFGVHTVSLRLFTVYGPRQRPDMGCHRIVHAALGGGTFFVYGSGEQVRDMTYVGDVVDACVRAATADAPPGFVANVAGGSEVSLNEVIRLVGELAGNEVTAERAAVQPGDVHRTGGDTALARQVLGWEPKMPLRQGLARQIAWHRDVVLVENEDGGC